MKRNLAVLLTLIVLIPLALLLWMGRRIAHGEQDRLERRIDALIADRLAGVDARLQVFVASRERDLMELTGSLPRDADALRDLTRADGRLASLFRLSPAGELEYPLETPDRPLTEAERDFLRRTEQLWKNRELWHATGESEVQPAAISEGAPNPKSSLSRSDASPLPALTSTDPYGWYPWHFEHGLNLLFWRRLDTGEIVGAELNRARLMSDLLDVLPDSAGDPAVADERTALLNADGEPIYQWGAYEPSEGERPRVTADVSSPLSSWRLAWYGSPKANSQAGISTAVATYTGIAALALALGLMAVYFYRESSREMREAARRVDFVGQVSHELKTPLTNIRMYAELLDHQIDETDDEARKDLSVIVSESRRLSRLIGNILTFSRKDRDAHRLRAVSGDLDAAVRDTVETFRPLLESKGVSIDLDLSAGEASFDRDVLEQIVGNLLSNVEKYGAPPPPGNGTLKVSTRRGDGRSVILVADEGPGIPPAEREKVFEPFYRVSDRLTDGVAGTGLGLSLSRDLARLHGGDLRLLDTSSGASFELTLADLPPKGASA